jgi:DNA mismatch endonuclease, patch repair protein
MRGQRARNTATERALRSELHRRGLRYRVHRRPIPGLRREADVVFGRVRLAVFVDGCFWHGCPEHGTWPKSNADFWRQKIQGNRVRDRDTDERLRGEGWVVIRVWEHEAPTAAADRIQEAVVHLGSLPAASKARAAAAEA